MNRKIKFVLIIYALIYILKIDSYALTYKGCESSKISRLRAVISNINISYDYYKQNNAMLFNINLTNLAPDIYIYDTSTYKTYYYSDTKNGELTIYGYSSDDTPSGQYKFYSKINGCNDTLLGAKYYNLPHYNDYYDDSVCNGIEDYYLCRRWSQMKYSYDDFVSLVNEYKEGLNNNSGSNTVDIEYNKGIVSKILDIYVKYYYYFLIGVIIICVTIIFIKNKKDRFKL